MEASCAHSLITLSRQLMPNGCAAVTRYMYTLWGGTWVVSGPRTNGHGGRAGRGAELQRSRAAPRAAARAPATDSRAHLAARDDVVQLAGPRLLVAAAARHPQPLAAVGIHHVTWADGMSGGWGRAGMTGPAAAAPARPLQASGVEGAAGRGCRDSRGSPRLATRLRHASARSPACNSPATTGNLLPAGLQSPRPLSPLTCTP